MKPVQKRIMEVQPLSAQEGHRVRLRHVCMHLVDKEGIPFGPEIPFHTFFPGDGIQDFTIDGADTLHSGDGAIPDFLCGNVELPGFFDGFSHSFRHRFCPDDIVLVKKGFPAADAGSGHHGQAAQQVFHGGKACALLSGKNDAAMAGCIDFADLFYVVMLPCPAVILREVKMRAGTFIFFGQRKHSFYILIILWIEKIGNEAAVLYITNKLYTFIRSHA